MHGSIIKIPIRRRGGRRLSGERIEREKIA